jgi:hypothetical protein
LTVQLSVPRARTWRGLWSKGLISVYTLGMLGNRLIVLILLLIRLLLWLLWTLALIGAEVIYPALLLIVSFRTHSVVEWGPIVLLVVRVCCKLRWVLLKLYVFRRYLRRVGILL